ncbi:FAD/NAD(P)-binding protein, partial [Ameyamaea chiangmaiensis]|nr:hydroxyacylglutathione hydrolase [Ameyamaea chiangmaiensis]
PCASLPPPVVSPGDTPPTVRAYLRAFRAAMAAGVAWRTAVDSLRPVTNALWNALPDVERRRFRRCLQRRWDILRHRMAPEVADRIDADRAAGSLRILDGHVTEVMTTPDGMAVHLRTRGGARTLTGARVVNCTGASLAYRHVASPLLAAMFRSGQIASGFADQGLDCTDAGQVRDAGGVPVPGLFALGPPRLGVLFESIAIPEIRQQAAALADYLAAYPAAGKHAADTAD